MNDRYKNKQLVNLIKSGFSDFKNEIKTMGEKEKQIEKPYKIVDIGVNILELNRRQQQGHGLKTLTLNHYQFL